MPLEYLVKRECGDYLHAWDEEWGTACMGKPRAMRFPTQAEADAAAERATQSCLNAARQPAGIKFYAVPAGA